METRGRPTGTILDSAVSLSFLACLESPQSTVYQKIEVYARGLLEERKREEKREREKANAKRREEEAREAQAQEKANEEAEAARRAEAEEDRMDEEEEVYI